MLMISRIQPGNNRFVRSSFTADLPVTTVPIYLHLQPVLVHLPFPEPPSSKDADSSVQPKHLTFIVTLHDDVHGLKQSTITQYSPADWMEVDYERSDWVEERLVDVIRVGVEVVIQEVGFIVRF